MLLKWRQHHFVRFLTLTGNPFPVPVGLQQVLKQTEILATYLQCCDVSWEKKQSSPATVLHHAYKYSVSTLKKLHSPYGKLSTRKIQER